MKAICIQDIPFKPDFYINNIYDIINVENYNYFNALENKNATAKMYEIEDKS